MEASKWLLDFRAVFLFCDFFFQKDKFFAFTYPEFILRISKPCHISIPVLVEILLSILTPQEHLKARNVMDRLPWPEGMSFYKHRAQRCSCPAFTPPSSLTARIEVNPGCWMLHVFFKSPISLLGSQSPLHDVASEFLLSAF